MPVPGLSLLGLKRIRGFVSILSYINPTIIIIIESSVLLSLSASCLDTEYVLKYPSIDNITASLSQLGPAAKLYKVDRSRTFISQA